MNTSQEQNVPKLSAYPKFQCVVNLDLRTINQIATLGNISGVGLNAEAYLETLPSEERKGINRMAKWIKIEGIDKVKRTIQRLMTIEGEV